MTLLSGCEVTRDGGESEQLTPEIRKNPTNLAVQPGDQPPAPESAPAPALAAPALVEPAVPVTAPPAPTQTGVHWGEDLTPAAWPGTARSALVIGVVLEPTGNAGFAAQLESAQLERRALPRLAAVLRSHAAPATYFVTAPWAAKHETALAEFAKDGSEVALLVAGTVDQAVLEADANAAVQRGLPFMGLMATGAGVEESTFEAAAALGFRWDSSLHSVDARPHELRAGARRMVELPAPVYLSDAHWFQNKAARDPETVLRVWKQEFDAAQRAGGMLMLTLHPNIIAPAHRLAVLDAFLTHTQKAPRAWLATATAVASHIRPASAPTTSTAPTATTPQAERAAFPQPAPAPPKRPAGRPAAPPAAAPPVIPAAPAAPPLPEW